MLLGDFFTISSIQKEGDSVKVMLELNAAHSIFEGHFPGQPVVPGACLLQMVKEIMQAITGSDMQLIKAQQLKFISLIDPARNGILQMALTHSIAENGEVTISAALSNDTVACFKFSGIFQVCK
ncbi:MAG: 3-hydroxyacyl-ACP dehydratase [Sediminibacterium sp.]